MTSPNTPQLPTDLITLEEAEQTSERSRTTLRRWIRDGNLKRWEGDPPARGGSAVALISRAELLSLLVEKGQIPRPFTPDHELEQTPDHEPPRRLELTLDEHLDTQPVPRRSPVDVRDLEEKITRLELSHQLDLARAELDRVRLEGQARLELERVRGELETARQQIAGLELQVASARQDTEGARIDARDWRDRYDQREAEVKALQKLTGLPWWRRLLGTTEGVE